MEQKVTSIWQKSDDTIQVSKSEYYLESVKNKVSIMSDLSKRGPKEAKFLNTTAFSFEDGCMHPLLKIDGCNCTRTDDDPVLRLGLILVFEYIRVINLKTRVYSKLEYLKSTSLYSSLN